MSTIKCRLWRGIYPAAVEEKRPQAEGCATPALSVRARRRLGRRSAGFTLVEMLASLAMVAIVLPVAMEAIGLTLSAAGFARQQREAAALAQLKLAELVSTGSWQNGDLSGDFSADQQVGLPPDWQVYTWTAVVADYPYQNGNELQELDLTVTWTARNVNQTVTLNTLIYTGGTGGNG